VAVALTGAAPTSEVPLDLSFTGAQRRTRRDATPLPPTAVTLGDTTVLLYDLVPGEQGPVGVTVRDGGAWSLAGVLGTGEAPRAFGERLARDGMEATLAKVLAATGPGVGLGWVDAPPPARRRAPRRPR
jgi:large repetitive protein